MVARVGEPESYALLMPTHSSSRFQPKTALAKTSRWVIVVAASLAAAIMVVGCQKDDDSDNSAKARTSTTLSVAGKRLQAGLAAQGAGNLDKAREDYLAVISQEPNNKVAHYNLGVVYQQLNDVKSATDAYRKALEIDPKYQPALFNLAVLLTPTDPPAAAGYYRQILAINPEDANVHFNLGLLLRETGQEAEGNAEVGKALELDPSLASRLPTSTAPPPTTAKR